MLYCCSIKFFWVRVCLYAVVSLLSQSAGATESDARYPQDALQCYSSSSANKMIICPKDRNSFCVKEVIDSSRRECGESEDYPLDYWDIKDEGCVYKKCSNACHPNTTTVFDNKGEEHSRYSLCCTDDLCNSATRMAFASTIIISIAAIVAVTL